MGRRKHRRACVMAATLVVMVLSSLETRTPAPLLAGRASAQEAPTSTRVVVAGDIATTGTLDTVVSDFLLGRAADLTLTAGDNINNSATDQGASNDDDYATLFTPTWGRLPGLRTSPGNHDCHIPGDGCAGYRTFFGTSDYYSFDVPGWHIVMLSSELRGYVSEAAWLAELEWLRSDLASVPTETSVFAVWHRPRYSSAKHLGAGLVQALWDILQTHGAPTVVVNGHNHVYERFAPVGVITQLEISPGGAGPYCVFDPTVVPQPLVSDGCAAHAGEFELASDGSWRLTAWRITSTAPPSVVEVFAPEPPPPSYPMTVEKLGTGTGAVISTPPGIECGATCSAEFDRNALVTLAAVPDPGSVFAGWSGDCTGVNTCTVSMTAARTVTAAFDVPAATYPLTVTRTGSGAGTVTSSPASIDCGPTCSAAFASGTVVTLIAVPDPGFGFAGWSGDCAGTGMCAVVIDSARSVTARFEPGPTVHLVSIASKAFRPKLATIAQGDHVRWTVTATSSRNVVDAIGLFDSGEMTPGSSYEFAYEWAGTFASQNTVGTVFKGKVTIPVVVAPVSGSVSTPFTVTWASAPPPAGYVFDVRVRPPGAQTFQMWQEAVTWPSSVFLAGSGPGTYSFQSRLRTPSGAASVYSPATSLVAG